MRILVAGGKGFIGRHVVEHLSQAGGHEVSSTIQPGVNDALSVDLLDGDAVKRVIDVVQPEVIINCAGVVGAGANFEDNVSISRNLLEGAAAVDGLKRFVMCGSAGEYGEVAPHELPVKETQALAATNPYSVSKVHEEEFVKAFADNHNMDVVVARIFNPLGAKMASRFLTSGVLRQIEAIRTGEADHIEVGRLDALRDYVDVRDAAAAIGLLATSDTHNYREYNIGTGVSTSTRELIDLILRYTEMPINTPVLQIMPSPEAPTACRADISRIRKDYGWEPHISIADTVKGIVL